MNIINIETFLAIVEHQSLSKASEKLFVSQSTISTRLNNLERNLNTILIKRHPGQKLIKLTPKGEEFITIAKKWMSLEKDTNLWVNKETPLRLNIGSVDSINIYILPPLFMDIINNQSPISINLSSHSSVQVFDALETHEIDIGLVSRMIRSNSLLGEPLFSEGMVLISSSLTSQYEDEIHPLSLDISKEIFLDWGPNFQIWHDYWWDPSDPTQITVDTAGLILKFINIPNSWAIVPRSVALIFKSTLPIKISELLKPPDERVYYKIIHRYPKPSSIKPLKLFEAHLHEFVNKSPFFKKIE